MANTDIRDLSETLSGQDGGERADRVSTRTQYMEISTNANEAQQVFSVSDLKATANGWGKRTQKDAPTNSAYNTWALVWYAPGAWSSPHHHENCESTYYFTFEEGDGKLLIYLGWPLSEARVIEATSATLMHMPAYEVHTFSNVGDTELTLLHTFSPPWKADPQGKTIMDLVDAETGRAYTDMDEYAAKIRERDDKYGTLDGYIEYLKEIGTY